MRNKYHARSVLLGLSLAPGVWGGWLDGGVRAVGVHRPEDGDGNTNVINGPAVVAAGTVALSGRRGATVWRPGRHAGMGGATGSGGRPGPGTAGRRCRRRWSDRRRRSHWNCGRAGIGGALAGVGGVTGAGGAGVMCTATRPARRPARS